MACYETKKLRRPKAHQSCCQIQDDLSSSLRRRVKEIFYPMLSSAQEGRCGSAVSPLLLGIFGAIHHTLPLLTDFALNKRQLCMFAGGLVDYN